MNTQLIEEIRHLERENMILRKLLWANHGCGFGALYGDDGEMQCHKCCIDFKRSTATYIEARFNEINMKEGTIKASAERARGVTA